jgi:hypothetical protein
MVRSKFMLLLPEEWKLGMFTNSCEEHESGTLSSIEGHNSLSTLCIIGGAEDSESS